MYILRTIVNWGWCPILIAALALISLKYEWELWPTATALGIILIIGLVAAVIAARDKQLERGLLRLKLLAGYFNRRFMGTSPLSIFSVIDSLFNIENPQIWEWARACTLAQRIFNTWCSSFITRVESDIRVRRFDVHLRTYLNELWMITNHYSEFIEQFHEITAQVEIA